MARLARDLMSLVTCVAFLGVFWTAALMFTPA